MNTAFVINDGSSALDVHHYNDDQVLIERHDNYVSDFIPLNNYNYLRFYINFDYRNAKTPDDLDIYIKFTPNLPMNSTARGIFLRVPTQTTKSDPGTSRGHVLYTDGDIPVYDLSCQILIENNNDSDYVMRNFSVIKIK